MLLKTCLAGITPIPSKHINNLCTFSRQRNKYIQQNILKRLFQESSRHNSLVQAPDLLSFLNEQVEPTILNTELIHGLRRFLTANADLDYIAQFIKTKFFDAQSPAARLEEFDY